MSAEIDYARKFYEQLSKVEVVSEDAKRNVAILVIAFQIGLLNQNLSRLIQSVDKLRDEVDRV